jgi:hypothetical protein
MHQQEMYEEHREFPNFDDFLEWKKGEENRTKTSYVQKSSSRIRNQVKFWYYYCHRSGVHRTVSKGKRALKLQGSCKLGQYCTAHMKVSQRDSSDVVTVEYCSTHHNHKPEEDIAHLTIPEDVRLSIAAKLLQSVAIDKIMDDIRDSVAGTGLQREHLITKQDIANIKRQFNTSGIERHANDHTSVCAWVEEMRTAPFNPILVFKPQGVSSNGLPEDDFLLVFQNEFQLEMLKEFGKNVVCCDATHATNVYGFLLITLMIIDDFGEGIPVAWAISTREDTGVLKVFFNALMLKAGPIVPSVFMSDDANQYWNAWSDTFGGDNTKKLLCAWHIDRAWRKALQERVTSSEDRASLYLHLRVLLGELEISAFYVLLQKFMSLLVSTQADFSDYFQRTYIPRITQWASCYRKCLHINTNMYVEAFHRVLKIVYLDSKHNRRVDHLLYILCKIARDKTFERFHKLHKGKTSSRITCINKRHREADVMLSCHCIVHRTSDSSWTVQSQHDPDKYYTVHLVNEACSCNMRCSYCDACLDMYTCSCVDSALHTTVCKHIHVVQCLFKNITHAHQCEEPDSPERQMDQETVLAKINSGVYLSSVLQTSDGHEALEHEKRKAMDVLSEITTLIASAQNPDALTSATKHLKQVASVMKALKDKEVCLPSLTVKKRLASIARNEKQKDFIKTKKNRQTAPRLSKGTPQDLNTCREALASIEVKVCAVCFKEDDRDIDHDTATSSSVVNWEQCSGCNVWIHSLCSQNSKCKLCANN